jgi:hypothetical protein
MWSKIGLRKEGGRRGRKIFVEMSPRREREGERGTEVMEREGDFCKTATSGHML